MASMKGQNAKRQCVKLDAFWITASRWRFGRGFGVKINFRLETADSENFILEDFFVV